MTVPKRPGPYRRSSLGFDPELWKVTPSQIVYSLKKYLLPSPEPNSDARKPK